MTRGMRIAGAAVLVLSLYGPALGSPGSTAQASASRGHGPELVYQWGDGAGGDAVFISRSDGSHTRRVGSDAGGSAFHPDWSPDGRQVVFADQERGLVVAAVDGSATRLVLSCGAFCDYPAWSPDGRRILFTQYVEPDCDCPPPASSLQVLDLRTGSVRPVVGRAQPYLVDVGRWSPDGRRIVYGIDRFDADFVETGSAIAVVDADGRNARELTPFSMFAYYPDWNRRTGRIVFSIETVGYGSPSTYVDTWDLFTIGPDGRGLRRLTDLPEGWHLWQPTWSPDGRSVVATLDRPEGGRHAVLVERDGTVSPPLLPASHARLRPRPA